MNKMNFRGKISMLSTFFLILFGFAACKDSKTITDTNKEMAGRNWAYKKKVSFPVKIEDEHLAYHVFINLRHTADYKYSNIFLLIHIISPEGKKTTERREFKLAYPDGEWRGSGAGNMYTYQLVLRENYHFPKKGVYTFEFEQNMRDNPLREVSDVGLRVEKAT